MPNSTIPESPSYNPETMHCVGRTKHHVLQIKNLCLHFSYQYICIWTLFEVKIVAQGFDKFVFECLNWIAPQWFAPTFCLFLEGKMPEVIVEQKMYFWWFSWTCMVIGNEKRILTFQRGLKFFHFTSMDVLYCILKWKNVYSTITLTIEAKTALNVPKVWKFLL